MKIEDTKLINEVKCWNAKKGTLSEYLKDKGLYEYIINRYDNNTTENEFDIIRETLYRIENEIDCPPVCKVCGGVVKFNAKKKRYPLYCSKKCINSDPECIKKNSESNKISKKNQYAERGNEIKTKRSETLKRTTGEDNNGSPFSCESIRNKAKKTMLERYGVERPVISKEVHKKSTDTQNIKRKEKWLERGLDVDYTDNKSVIVHKCCKKHGDVEIPISVFNNRTKPGRIGKAIMCIICNPVKTKIGTNE